MRTLIIPPKVIVEIAKLMNSKIEYGGWLEFDLHGKHSKTKTIKGQQLSVSVPTEYYELHWHTHPEYLVSSGTIQQTGPFQPPSRDDIAQSSAKYFDVHFIGGTLLKQLVFTSQAVYIQECIPSVLEKFFKTKDFIKKDDKTDIIWTNKWYTPFKTIVNPILRQIQNIGLDLGGYIDDDTGKHVPPSESDYIRLYKDSEKLEKAYFDVCKEFGVKVTKIMDWKGLLKNGMQIKVN